MGAQQAKAAHSDAKRLSRQLCHIVFQTLQRKGGMRRDRERRITLETSSRIPHPPDLLPAHFKILKVMLIEILMAAQFVRLQAETTFFIPSHAET